MEKKETIVSRLYFCNISNLKKYQYTIFFQKFEFRKIILSKKSCKIFRRQIVLKFLFLF